MSLKADMMERMKGLALDKVDIVFIKGDYLFQRISDMRGKFPGVTKPIQLVKVPETDDLTALSHVDMRALGWVRKEKITVQDAVAILEENGFEVEISE